MGAWYVQETTPSWFQPPGTTCDVSFYTEKADGTFQVNGLIYLVFMLYFLRLLK